MFRWVDYRIGASPRQTGCDEWHRVLDETRIPATDRSKNEAVRGVAERQIALHAMKERGHGLTVDHA